MLLCSSVFVYASAGSIKTLVCYDSINNQYEFTLSAEEVTYDANAIVAVYDNQNICRSLAMKDAKAQNNTIVKIPYSKEYSRYNVMMWDNENALKPLCSSTDGIIDSAGYPDAVTILSDDVVSVNEDTGKITFYPFDNEDTAYTVFVDTSAEYMMFNDEIYEFYVDELTYFLEDEDMILCLSDKNNDMLYEEIEIFQYVYGVVENVDLSRDIISFLDSQRLELDYDDADIIIEDYSGNELELTDIKSGDFLGIICDSPGNIARSEYIRIIKLDDYSLNTVVDDVYEKDGKAYVVLNQRPYENTYEVEINTGDEGVFYVTLSGKLCGYVKDYASLNYGYILQGELMRDRWVLTILDENGDIIMTQTNDSAAVGEYIENNPSAFNVQDGKFNFADATEKQKRNSARFITYDYAENGIVIEEAESYDFRTINTEYYTYNESNNTVGKCKLKDDVLIFDISGGMESTVVTDKTHLKDYYGYSGFLFANPVEISAYSVMLITGSRNFNLEQSKGLAIALETTDTEIRFVQDEREKIVSIDNAEILNASGKLPKYGDVFYYYDTNADKNAEAIITIATLEKNDEDQAYFVLTPEADTPEEISTLWSDSDVSIRVGYILNEYPIIYSKGEGVYLTDDEMVIIPDTANRYLYENDTLEISDYMEYAYEYRGTLTASPILVRLDDSSAVDTYTTTDMFDIE